MVALNENTLRENYVAARVALEETHGIGLSQVPNAPLPNDFSHLEILTPTRPGIVRRAVNAILKTVFIVLTTQAVITAVLVCFVAVVTAQHASQIIGAKFSAINSALKKLTP